MKTLDKNSRNWKKNSLNYIIEFHSYCCCCSVAKSCPTLYNLMDCSTPGSSVLHCLLEFAQLMSIELVMLSNHLITCHPFLLCCQSFPETRCFPMSWLLKSGGQIIGASASTSVLPMNVQGWFPLGLTCLIPLMSMELSRVFSSTTIKKHQFFSTQPSLWSNSHICTWLLEKHSLDNMKLCQKSNVFAF